MDTIAINLRFLEQEIIVLARMVGEVKLRSLECQKKWENEQKKGQIEEKMEELLSLQEDMWQYIQNLEIVQRMYKDMNEKLMDYCVRPSELLHGYGKVEENIWI